MASRTEPVDSSPGTKPNRRTFVKKMGWSVPTDGPNQGTFIDAFDVPEGVIDDGDGRDTETATVIRT